MTLRIVLPICLFLTAIAAADGAPKTVVEFSEDKDFGGLATSPYEPTRKERPYYRRLSRDARWTIQESAAKNAKSDFKFEFHLAGHRGQFVGWSGIVRNIERARGQRGGTLLIENKYAGDVTDDHMQTVEIKGGGDFKAELTRIPKDLIPLVLVRVYGVVGQDEKGLPVIRAEYVRVWRWFQFNFMDFGEDHGNPEWNKGLRLKPGERVYRSRPSLQYYADRLGPTVAQLEAGAKWEEARKSTQARLERLDRFLASIHAAPVERARLLGVSVICGVLAGAFTRRILILLGLVVGLQFVLIAMIFYAAPLFLEERDAQSWQLYLIPMFGLQTFLWSLAAALIVFLLGRMAHRVTTSPPATV